MSKLKIAAIGGALAVSMLSAPAFAQVAATLGTWTTLTQTDKTITLVDASDSVDVYETPAWNGAGPYGIDFTSNSALPGASVVSFGVNSSGDHQVNLTGPAGFAWNLDKTVGNIFAVQYIINIDTSTYPPGPDDERFGTVRLSLNATSPFGDFRVTKRVQGLTPVAATGGVNPWAIDPTYDLGAIFDTGDTLSTTVATDVTVFCGVCTRFLVTDYITVLASGNGTVLNQITNTYQQVVPVPAPLALLATGLLGIGALRRMKKA